MSCLKSWSTLLALAVLGAAAQPAIAFSLLETLESAESPEKLALSQASVDEALVRQPLERGTWMSDAPDPLTSTMLPTAVDIVDETVPEESAALGPESDVRDRPVEIAQSIPSVNTLSDVQPTDWAYQALRSLIDNYGCLSGFSDGTFRGNQPLTRYQFAAALSACLDAIVEVMPQDAPNISRLQQEFAQEISARVDVLEAELAELRGNQFSTTTRLFGQVVFGLQGRGENRSDFFPVDGRPDTDDPGAGIVTLYSNAQLSLLTQFSPRSILLLGLQAGKGNSLFDTETGRALGLTNNIRLAYEGDTNNSFRISDLTYRHLVTNNFAVIAGGAGVDPVGVFRGPNRVESAGSGPLSLFAQRNPVVSIGNGQAGVGFDWQLSDRLSLQGVYSAAGSNDPNDGLLRGDRTLGFQVTASPTDSIDLAIHYINSFSRIGNLGTGIGDAQLTVGDALTTNAIGATVAWQLNPRLTLGSWAGYTTSVTPGEVGSVETANWMFYANFPDLFRAGNLGGIYIGQPPRINSSTLRQGQNIPDSLAGNLGDPGGQNGRTIHFEVFYRYQITDYLSITPGLITIFNPDNANASDTITIGALRTTFTF